MEENSKQLVLKIELPQIVNDALSPLAKSIGTTLSNCWDGMLMGVNTWYGKKKIDHDKNLELYMKQINKEVASIPEDNLQEPKMNILGPALDASKFYFEEEQYREMFSKLIAGSMDNRLNDKIHPFFIEAIKQMTTRDAYLLSLFKTINKLPLAKYMLVKKTNRGRNEIYMNIFYRDNIYTSPDYYSKSFINLQRLGFIEITYAEYLTNTDSYKIYEKDPIYAFNSERYKENNEFDFTYEKGMASITDLGKNFLDVCI